MSPAPPTDPRATAHALPAVTRRRLLQGLLATGGLGVAALRWPSGGAPIVAGMPAPIRTPLAPIMATTPTGSRIAGAPSDRILVVVELQGGNDGLSTLVPAGSGRYHDLRPDLALDDALAIDDEVGLAPTLSRLHGRGVGVVEGVGPVEGDLSHFAMTARWERGDVDGSGGRRNGFLGRLADTLVDPDGGEGLVAVATGGPTPFLTASLAPTMALGSPDDLWFLRPTDWTEAARFQEGLRELARAHRADDAWSAMVADAHDLVLDVAASLPDTDEDGADDGSDDAIGRRMVEDGGYLGEQLRLAADLVAADVGVRIVHARLDGFDTHDDHRWLHPDLLGRVDAAVDGFLTLMEDQGRGGDVLVATVSEFGRRVPENGEGLDHGAASTMLVAGGGVVGRHGEPSPLDDLDDDDNLRVTVPFDRYLASLAEWVGVEPGSVLGGDPAPAFRAA